MSSPAVGENPADTLNSNENIFLDPLVMALAPVMEVISDRIIHTDGQERIEYWEAFQKMWEIYPENMKIHGQLYCRFLIGNILMILTRAREIQAKNDVPALEGTFPDRAIQEWTQNDWNMFEQYLRVTADALKRKDADARPGEDTKELDVVNPIRENDPLLTVKVEKIINYIKVYRLLVPVRKPIEEQLLDESVTHPKLEDNLAFDLWKDAGNEVAQVKKQIVNKIFDVKEGMEDSYTSTAPPLKTIEELRTNYWNKPFIFDRFHERCNVLMIEWSDGFLDDPQLNPFYFPEDSEHIGGRTAEHNPVTALRDLRKSRETLSKTGLDPLEESLRIARGATRQSNSSPQTRTIQTRSSPAMLKRKGAPLTFEEGEVDSVDPNGDGTHTLGNLPNRANIADPVDNERSPKKAKKSQQKKYKGRRAWTEDEKQAIIEGVRSHGRGQWAKIKDEYSVLFQERVSSQIKDCFRRMVDKKEIPDDLLFPEETVEQTQAEHVSV